MTSQASTDRMIRFVESDEAEEYAAKLQLRFAPLFTEDGRKREAVAVYLRERIGGLYELFNEIGDEQAITRDVPNLDEVDWAQIADLVMIG